MSTPADSKHCILSIPCLSPTPTAAPTNSLPNLSLDAKGNFSAFSMSFTVISPTHI